MTNTKPINPVVPKLNNKTIVVKDGGSIPSDMRKTMLAEMRDLYDGKLVRKLNNERS